MIKIIILVLFAFFVAIASLCRPDFLATNTFLQMFVTHEVLSLMAVVMTVTLASIANVYLSINRIVVQKHKNDAKMIEAAGEIKKELKDNCWLIFWGFLVVLILLVAKGSILNNSLWISIINGSVLWFLLLYLLCMFDVYQVVFGVAGMDDTGTESK